MDLVIGKFNEHFSSKSVACFIVCLYYDLLKENVKKLEEVDYLDFFFPSFSLTEKNKNHIKLSLLTENVAKVSLIKQIPFLITDKGELIYSTSEIMLKLLSYSTNKSDPVDEEVKSWIKFADNNDFDISSPQALKELDFHLERRVFFASSFDASLADLAIYSSVYRALMSIMDSEGKSVKIECKSLINLRRWFDHIQNLPKIRHFAKTFLTVIDVTEKKPSENIEIFENKKSKSEKREADNRNIQPKKEKTNKVKKAVKEVQKDERPIDDVTRLEIKVGLIKKVWRHPEAERLYCEEVDIGEEKPREIASGLVGFVEEKDLLGQKVLVLANIKPKVLKGFVSHGMILCASSPDKTKIELMMPHPETSIGERVTWEGLEGHPDVLMNSKSGKDPFAAVQPVSTLAKQRINTFVHFHSLRSMFKMCLLLLCL